MSLNSHPSCCLPPYSPWQDVDLIHAPLPLTKLVGLVDVLGAGFRVSTKWLFASVSWNHRLVWVGSEVDRWDFAHVGTQSSSRSAMGFKVSKTESSTRGSGSRLHNAKAIAMLPESTKLHWNKSVEN